MIPLNTVGPGLTIHTTRTNYIITELVATMTTEVAAMTYDDIAEQKICAFL